MDQQMGMVRRIICATLSRMVIFLVCIAMMLQCFSKMLIVAEFYANRAYIVRTQCINRDRPVLHCGGQCQLHKRLQHDNNDDSTPDQRPTGHNDPLSSRSFFLTDCYVFLTPASPDYALTPTGSPVDQPSTHFHPPGSRLLDI